MNSRRPSHRPPRIDVAIKAVLTTSDNVTFAVLIRDLSATGFRVEACVDEELLIGEPVKLDVPGEQVLKGEIRWTAGRVAGGVFTA